VRGRDRFALAAAAFLEDNDKDSFLKFDVVFGAVGIEFGFLLMYRSGWNLGIASVLSTVFASLILVPVAVFVFKDKISWVNIAGILVCLVGLVMLNWKR
jgi:multidrug transporter EmrE-like cation transporter